LQITPPIPQSPKIGNSKFMQFMDQMKEGKLEPELQDSNENVPKTKPRDQREGFAILMEKMNLQSRL